MEMCRSGNDDDNFFIFVLLSRESIGGVIRTNPDSLRSNCLCFQVFRFASDCVNLLLVRFFQAGRIIVKHLIQEHNNEALVGVEPSILVTISLVKRHEEGSVR